ncbi:MAG: glycerol-3-phosphate dehydrogenase subunit GlpB [Pseudomonadota bacterium]
MNVKQQIECDLLVIGSGFAGMAAAGRASTLGLKTVQTGSSSSFFLASGLIDLLGVWPLEKQQILKMPETGVKLLKDDLPGHPYSKLAYTDLLESLAFIKGFLSDAGLKYQSEKQMNQFVLTAAGSFKPSFLIPKTFVNGCTKNLNHKRVLFVDFKGLKGYSARQVANVSHWICPDAISMTIEIPEHSGDLTPVALANLFESDQFINLITKIIQPRIKEVDLVGFPAVCGVYDSLAILTQIEELIGRPCFEIPGMPPSIPGVRLKNAFEKQLSKQDVMVLNNARVKFNSFKDQAFFMTAVNQTMETPIKAKGVILATGRFQGDGLHAKRGLIQETIFDLPVHQPQQREQWYDRDFFNPKGHAVNQAGIETTLAFQPMDKTGNPRFEHLYAAGSILAHNDWARLKSGAGVSCVSAVTAVNCFYDAFKGGQ